ncbi:MAG TPA: hypothetical protein VF142_05845 [Longimicrobium sp.]
MRKIISLALILVAFLTTVLLAGYMRVGKPVADVIAADPRNEALHIAARQAYYVNPRVLVLDLKSAESASPADLWRVLFDAAEALLEHEREFDQVILARRGTPVFVLSGSDFETLGKQRDYGENPLYMIRKLPSMLHHPDGNPAYGEWEGGLFGVLTREMEDANSAASRWVEGSASE